MNIRTDGIRGQVSISGRKNGTEKNNKINSMGDPLLCDDAICSESSASTYYSRTSKRAKRKNNKNRMSEWVREDEEGLVV